MCHDINCLQRIRRAWMPINKAYLLFLKRSKYQRDKERAMRNLVRFEGLGANSHLLNDRMQVDDDPSAAMESLPLSYTCKFNRLNVERVIDYRVSISTFLGITCSAAAKIPLTWRPYRPASSQRNALNYKGHGIFWGLGLEPLRRNAIAVPPIGGTRGPEMEFRHPGEVPPSRLIVRWRIALRAGDTGHKSAV